METRRSDDRMRSRDGKSDNRAQSIGGRKSCVTACPKRSSYTPIAGVLDTRVTAEVRLLFDTFQ